MEKTVAQLEAMKAESGANYLSQILDLEFKNSEEIEANPLLMLQKLNDVKKEYSALVEEAAAIQRAQQDGERPEEFDQLEKLLGVKFPISSEDSSSSNTESSQSDGGSKQKSLSNKP